MSDIHTFHFSDAGADEIKSFKYGSSWPVVYLIENGKDLYVGETTRAYGRTKEHLDSTKRTGLRRIHIVSDSEYNKSATLDAESSLIEYMVADGVYHLQNGNGGLQNHEYYDREMYKGKFEVLWEKLRTLKLVKHSLLHIRNTDLFKYSPYKTLTDDQYLIARKLLKQFELDKKQAYVVHGGPGTGKTILATFLIKQLVEKGYENVALVIAMTSLRKTLQRVFRSIPGLKSTMVISPSDVSKKKYDVLVVDETHRLRQRRNITNYRVFDETNKKLVLPKDADELDWIVNSAQHVVLFYDERQSVRPSDIAPIRVKLLKPKEYQLQTQMRVLGGEAYIEFIDDLLEVRHAHYPPNSKYDFKMYDSLDDMVRDIKSRDREHSLCRLVAGYAWEWVSRNNPKQADIVIGDTRLFWNSQITDWVNSKNAVNEVGCIHTIQGYDLNYTGVILGPEITYSPEQNEIVVDRRQYFDANGHRGVTDPAELKRYIINIYKTLLTRGILGTYVYVVDDALREYLRATLQMSAVESAQTQSVESPIQFQQSRASIEYVAVPLVGSAPCGGPLTAEQNIEEYIQVERAKIRPGFTYFILRAEGDSMNLAGINDGDLVLCRTQEKADTGERVVALLGGENVTIKYYDKRDGRRILLPKSTNKSHTPIVPDEGDSVQGVVQEVLDEEDR